jgi:autoinducer 2-degrading protein
MFYVTVLFEVDDRHLPEFIDAVRLQARDSLELEKDCRRFDVCIDPYDLLGGLLYEIYTDKAAFDVHLKTGHFKAFDQSVRNGLVSKKVESWERLQNGESV